MEVEEVLRPLVVREPPDKAVGGFVAGADDEIVEGILRIYGKVEDKLHGSDARKDFPGTMTAERCGRSARRPPWSPPVRGECG